MTANEMKAASFIEVPDECSLASDGDTQGRVLRENRPAQKKAGVKRPL